MSQGAPFRCLGHDRGLYHYLADGVQQVTSLAPTQHTKLNLLRLAPISYWESVYHQKNGANWDAAANALLQHSHRVGIFNPERIRGRGAWTDHGQTVVHLGDRLLVDGVDTPLSSGPNGAIYELAQPIPFSQSDPLKPNDAKCFLEICKLPTWQRPVDGYLLAGWCAIAPICGALSWRPHLWVTGARGSGKSTLYAQLVEPIIGPMAVNPGGGSSEAGIRQTLGHDARPVLFDEAEGQAKKSKLLMDEILVLMRGASSETKSRIVKGTTSGQAMDFRMRSCFGLFSIGIAATQSADTSRVTVLSLAINHLASTAQREAHYADFKRRIALTMTPAYTERFRARMVRLIPTIRANAETFAEAWAIRYGDRRVGDQLGALLSGAYACASDATIALPAADQWLQQRDWSEERSQQDERDEVACLARIMDHAVMLDSTRVVRSVGQLVARLAGADTTPDPKVSTPEAEQALRMVGVVFHRETLMVRISSTHPGLATALSGTHWDRNWTRTLRRLPGASWDGRQRFTSQPERFVGVPLLTAIGDE